MSDKISTNQQFNAQSLPEFALPAVVVTAPRLTSYDWYGIWKNIFAAVDPQSPVFINPTLTHQNILDGYRLRENPLGIGLSWRVTASGRVHPDDLKQCTRQEEIFYSHMLPAAKDATVELSQESIKTDNVMSINTDRLLLANGIVPGRAEVIQLSSAGAENGIEGSIFDKVSDKWRQLEAWRERGKYLRAYENAKQNLEIFKQINPNHPEYEDILAVEVERCISTEESSPLGIGRVGALTKSVYYSVIAGGVVRYVGITNDVARRSAEHFRIGREIEALIPNLSVRDARAVEQALIELHGLGHKGGTLMNKINSISPSNPEYAKLIQRGYELLKSIDYGGMIP